MEKCSVEGCDHTTKRDHWNNIRSQDAGWFFQKDGTIYCPEHVPEWVADWRARKQS